MNKKDKLDDLVIPSQTRITNCQVSGWVYLGDGLFEHPERNMMGFFTNDNSFVKVSNDD